MQATAQLAAAVIQSVLVLPRLPVVATVQILTAGATAPRSNITIGDANV
jgi:hypothetical protein